MRQKRILAQDAWYEVRTAVNNREPLFRLQQAAQDSPGAKAVYEELKTRFPGGKRKTGETES